MNKASYYPNYYSIDDIFVTQERVPVETQMKLHQMGFLDPSSHTVDLQPKQTLEIPLWYFLQTDRRNPFYKLKIPDIYTNNYKEICNADATIVDLGKLNKYYYEFGRHIARFDTLGQVSKMIFEVCRNRARYIKDLCNNIHNDVRSDNNLEFLENELYTAGCKTNKMFSDWLMEKSVTIKTSELVVNHRKRKRDAMQDT